MKLPRNIGGDELIKRLAEYGYKQTRQTGSHARLTSSLKGTEHHITIPKHNPLKVGTLNSLITSVSEYLKKEKQQVIEELFKA
jgi:predicted RNA binding protein YcfA (HicA-like mRNA interferase family)